MQYANTSLYVKAGYTNIHVGIMHANPTHTYIPGTKRHKYIYKVQSLLNELITVSTSSLYLQSLRTIIRWIQIASIHDKFQHLFIRQALVRLLSQAGDFPKDHAKGPANDNWEKLAKEPMKLTHAISLKHIHPDLFCLTRTWLAN